jgi:hypothetical protein
LERSLLALSIFALAGAIALHSVQPALAQDGVSGDFKPTCVVIGTDVGFAGPAERFLQQSKSDGARHFIGGPAYLCAY